MLIKIKENIWHSTNKQVFGGHFLPNHSVQHVAKVYVSLPKLCAFKIIWMKFSGFIAKKIFYDDNLGPTTLLY